MRRVKSCNTGPEMVVRHLLHKLGYRLRLHRVDLLGNLISFFQAEEKSAPQQNLWVAEVGLRQMIRSVLSG